VRASGVAAVAVLAAGGAFLQPTNDPMDAATRRDSRAVRIMEEPMIAVEG
jgi:hypothetical protein